MSRSGEAGLARYLMPSEEQGRLLRKMAEGHARDKHGRELGVHTRGQHRAQVRAHLSSAPLGLTVNGPEGRPRHLLADARTGRVAWITPHKEHRSTFFEPRAGVHDYLRAVVARGGDLQPLDLAAVRANARATARAPTHRITSSVRALNSSSSARVP